MKFDFSTVRFPNEEVSFVDDRIAYEDVVNETHFMGIEIPFVKAVKEEWKRRQRDALLAQTA